MATKVFRGGIPYAIDVKRLTEAFPVPTLIEGRIISHDQFEAVLDTPRQQQRYYAVINSWLSQIKHSTGIVGVWEPGDGVVILDPAGILKYSESKTHQKMRQTAKAMKILSYSDRNRLDAIGQQRFDHVARRFSLIRAELDNHHRQLAIDLAPVKSLPKPKIIREAV